MNYKQATCPTGTMPYTIVAGDTFYLVAMTFGISVDSLLVTNPGIDPNKLYIGQVICVPGICSYGTIAYTIKAGDTIYNIAGRYNTTVDAIMNQNPGLKQNNLNISQVICIPQN